MTTENKIRQKRIYPFIVFYGLFCGLVFAFNLWLVNFIGYLAIYTNFIFVIFIFLFFIKVYELIFKIDLKLKPSIFIGFPVFLIALAVFRFCSDFGSAIHYTEFGKLELIKEWFAYAAVMTALLSFVFRPFYNWRKRSKKQLTDSYSNEI